MTAIPEIRLYGSAHCHKTQYYKELLSEMGLPYEFLDVEANKEHAELLRDLYENGKLNFPTITIGKKKLRNPPKAELEKWVNKLVPQRLNISHDRPHNRFTLDINGELAKVVYRLEAGKMYLVHSEVPYNLRGLGIGKVLVEKSFEKLTEEGYEAVAVCSFIRAVAQRSDTWRNIIAQEL